MLKRTKCNVHDFLWAKLWPSRLAYGVKLTTSVTPTGCGSPFRYLRVSNQAVGQEALSFGEPRVIYVPQITHFESRLLKNTLSWLIT